MLEWGEGRIVALVTLDPTLAATKPRYTALEPLAAEHGIPLVSVRDMRGREALNLLAQNNPDLVLEVGWSHRIPKPILDLPHLGAIGIHNSLLPGNRGMASLNWALIRGETVWGTTLFYLEESIDSGEIIAQRSYQITAQDDINTLFAKADTAAVAMLRDILPKIRAGTSPRTPQDPALVSWLPRRRPEDGKIDWRQDAKAIYNLVRALKSPYPNAFTFLRGKKICIADARLAEAPPGKPGSVTSVGDSVVVGTRRGAIALLRVRCEGEPEIDAHAFAKNHGLHIGDRFDS
jgi:methionyl-tRNA formyltransferase